ncbi:zinc finger protein [Verticillium alfalfae VaMs.102]|uniref:Zinc finger protein n=1 Tax=Verticillium alfalfae (strain VaMs.102 / ATCC MYA-4576 / FGSC 10136) TaxID=526221 RepID=C9SX65_VERA1|nr:zinc finger protein [Verticillium alfalfae VaMs.102]EEY23255.1 zinc finger protein [Verticillium alfalfae VaMs.102]
MSRQSSSEHGDFNSYPEPPHGLFASSQMDMSIPTSSYMFPASMGFEQATTYADATQYVYNGQQSPGVFEEGDLQMPPSNHSTASACSSNAGSPLSHHGQIGMNPEWTQHGLGLTPGIVPSDFYSAAGTEYTSYTAPGMEDFTFEFPSTKPHGFVDPSLIHPEISRPVAMPGYEAAYHHAYPASPSASSSPQPAARNASRSPFLHEGYQPHYSPYSAPLDGRRPSIHSFQSGYSEAGNAYSGDETKEKQRCPHPDCGKTFKDLKAHMLTHQNERPEKCPIQTCDYHVKGFARKYDKNRHTLTHYKGNMVCGFCPGSGTPAEKSFNRADVFKRHLTAVHGVEQTPPNSRKKTSGANTGKKLTGYPPDATGKCSTCSQTFSNAQDFYEHLDDCVLRIVQQEDPSEANNARLLAEVENDKKAMTRRMTLDMDEDGRGRGVQGRAQSGHASARRSGMISGAIKSRGMTHSRGGVPGRVDKSKGRKSKQQRPKSWDLNKDLVKMKKRVLGVFDGPRRLAKDDMVLSTEHEVRIKLQDGKSYVTDLDMFTVMRAEGFHGATDAEKGAWVSDDPTPEQYQQMQALLKQESVEA